MQAYKEVRKIGYKQTELGLIPEDWISYQFQDVLSGFSSGMTPYRAIPEYYSGSIPWVTSGELNYNIIVDTDEKITEQAVINTNLKLLPIGTFLIAITGLEAAGTRGSCAITGIKATTNQSCMALFPMPEKLLTKYLYFFYLMYGNEFAFKYCQGTKQQSYTGKIVKLLPINLPPTLQEQKAIAEALSDVDGLIDSLDVLIAKKKAIKQGAMQRLLTPPHKGGQCLPGFEGEWEEKKLGEVANINMGQSPLSSNYNNLSIGLPLVQGNADIKNRETIIRNYTSQVTKIANIGDIIMSVRAPVGEIAKATFECCIGRGVCAINYQNEFLFHYLIYFESSWQKFSTGSTFDSINSNQLKNIVIPIPKDLNEQKTIAQILSDMDNGIEALKAKKDKYKAVKQGMMQDLLTGKKRLV